MFELLACSTVPNETLSFVVTVTEVVPERTIIRKSGCGGTAGSQRPWMMAQRLPAGGGAVACTGATAMSTVASATVKLSALLRSLLNDCICQYLLQLRSCNSHLLIGKFIR